MLPVKLDEWKDLHLINVSHKSANQWLHQTVEAFVTFSNEYRQYFQQIIEQSAFKPDKTTVRRLQERVEQALNEYWAPFERVIEQWQMAGYREILEDGTDQAIGYLEKMKLDPEKSGILLYFDKIPMIRRCPYINIVVLGVPYRLVADTEPVNRDWMAIPHELGHYAYWNLGDLQQFRQEQQRIREEAATRIQTSSVVKKLEEKEQEAIIEMFLGWLEEIFADMVGTQLGEDRFVNSLQTIMERMVGNKEDLKENDGTHPPFCMRPFVRLKMMELQGKLVPNGNAIWDNFFDTQFSVKKFGSHHIQANLPLLEADLDTMAIDKLKAIFSSESTVSFTVAQVKAAMEPMLVYLKQEIDALFARGFGNYRGIGSAFGHLKALAEAEAKANNKPIYEVLLQPRILEGTEYASHWYWRHGKWHNHVHFD